MKKRKRYPVTLIEIMIVIVLISLIGGALAFNMRGSLDQGRAFKTEQNISRVYDTLMMEYAKGDADLKTIVNNKEKILERSSLFKEGEKLLKDGWGQDLSFQVEVRADDINITSKKLKNWKDKHE